MDTFSTEPTEANLDDRPVAVNALIFVVVMAIFVAGMWAMGEGIAQHSALLFSGGLLGSCLAVGLAVGIRRD
ncbi:hypothetical protein [Sanguibacter massiliensis]|uniref:hypothetical protein n=1 Tax=Sanguibacter massiliensis TaxID=1973217 RepID=UPI000C84AC7B|nr:hypothetical protein [Sanguibacter massiliensis]